MTIIHISTDYPDSFDGAKTRAISNLIGATAQDFDHYVYSLNRTALSPVLGLKHWIGRDWTRGVDNIDNNGLSVWSYAAPSRGLFLKSSLSALADILSEDIAKKGLKPSLVQGHKLSMEGIIAQHVARNFDVPFAVSIQGNTDRMILNIRRDLWPLYRSIFHDAAVIFPFSPWAFDYCESVLGPRAKKTIMLPCMTAADTIIAPKISDPIIMSAFHLRHWKLKNFDRLARAGHNTALHINDFALDIYGGGDAQLSVFLQKRINGYSPNVSLRGALEPSMMQHKMNDHAAFAMVSNRESYGMVFAESVLAGCPIIYPKNAAVDGYFDGCSFAQAVPSGDEHAIGAAMQKAVTDQKEMKDDLRIWQLSGAAQNFQRDTIMKNYRDGIGHAIATK